MWAEVTLNDRLIPVGTTELFHGFVGNTDWWYIYKSYKAISNPDNIECSSGVLKTAMYDPEEDQTIVLYQFQNKFPIVRVFTGIVSATGEQSV